MQHAEGAPRGIALPALREVRERVGLSQDELATQAGLTRTAVANLERGTSHARPSNARRLAEALHVSVDVLAGNASTFSNATPSAEQPQAGVLSAYLDAAMRHAVFRRAGEQQRIYVAIQGIPGLWARGHTRDEAARDLREALEWWVLTSVFEHRPLPAFDGLSLEIEEEGADGIRTLYPVAAPDDTDPLATLGPDAQPAPA